ncbi:MAG TPA: biotin/lipoyl-containing protein [Paludibacter sp.]
MAVVVILPKQGQSVESCIITEIKKKKGDTVKKGQVLFTYETDKATFEEESPVDGVVLESFYNEGDEVAVLLDMMVIGQPGDDYAGLLQSGSPEVSSEQQAVSAEHVAKTEEHVKAEVVAPTQNSELLFRFSSR